jgi:hypothetical protein
VISQKLRIRPSEYVGLRNEVEAWAFDRACTHLGMEIETDLDKITHKNSKILEKKREQRLQKWLGGAETAEGIRKQ